MTTMKKSLCCISLQLQEKGLKANTMTKTRFLSLERKNALSTISQRTLNNVNVAVNTFSLCVTKGWNYRISSDLFPLATLPEANLSLDILTDKDCIYNEFKRGAEIIKKNNLRCSTHPDQFVVPASVTKTVVEKSIVELKNHASIMDLFGLPQTYESPINIHMNIYKGGTKEIAKRFIDVYNDLPINVKSRLVLENEDKTNSWKVEELYELIYSNTGIPITYDNLHFRCNPGKLSAKDAVKLCVSTWGKYRPLFHFSDNDIANKNPRAHGDYVRSIPNEYVDLDVDFEFEFKAKDYALDRFENEFEKELKNS
jgi:UV DNA damage endonuclease